MGSPWRSDVPSHAGCTGSFATTGLDYHLCLHHVEGGNAGRDLDLDIDRAGLDALERDRGYTLDHECPRRSAILT
jgi:hypothetical protein